MDKTEKITSYNKLLASEGKKVTILGTFVKYNAIPKMSSGFTLYVSGILMEGDSIPLLFLEEPKIEEEQDTFDGKKVEVTGVFHLKQPVKEGDPPHASTFRGSWIYNIDTIKIVQ